MRLAYLSVMQYASLGVMHYAYQNMNLRTFLDKLERGGISEFAAKVKVSPIYLSQLAAVQDGRVPSPELCVAIEQATDGVVMRWSLRPNDWYRIWPELIGIEGSPEVPAIEEKVA